MASDVVYEVNLAIDRDIEEEYILWLEAHIPEVLIVDGFKHAVIYSREASDDPSVDRAFYTVQYSVESREALEAYFSGPAQNLRKDGIDRFGNKFSATRRILLTPKHFEKEQN